MTEEELADFVAEVVVDKFEQLATKMRADFTEQLFELQAKASAPHFELTPMGELFCNGRKVGDVRNVFRDVVDEVLAKQLGDKP
jgi:hypothetical protein